MHGCRIVCQSVRLMTPNVPRQRRAGKTLAKLNDASRRVLCTHKLEQSMEPSLSNATYSRFKLFILDNLPALALSHAYLAQGFLGESRMMLQGGDV
jgi:hypothetical protein